MLYFGVLAFLVFLLVVWVSRLAIPRRTVFSGRPVRDYVLPLPVYGFGVYYVFVYGTGIVEITIKTTDGSILARRAGPSMKRKNASTVAGRSGVRCRSEMKRVVIGKWSTVSGKRMGAAHR